jgi:hypothetical protein
VVVSSDSICTLGRFSVFSVASSEISLAWLIKSIKYYFVPLLEIRLEKMK